VLDGLDDDGRERVAPGMGVRVRRVTLGPAIEGGSDDVTAGEAILGNSAHPEFETVLDRCVFMIAPDGFLALYLILLPHFTDCGVGEAIVHRCTAAFTRLGERDVAFFECMADVHFFTLLLMGTESLAAASFDLVALLVQRAPDLVDATLKRVLAAIISKRPVDAVNLLSVYV